MSVQELLQEKAQKKIEETKKREEAENLPLSDDEKKKVLDMIENNQVVVFSKSYCPFCRQAKMTFNSIENFDYKVVEMDDGQHDGWQWYIAEVAKTKPIPSAANNNTKSVPQIFVNQKYIGGADDLADLYADKSLAGMLGRAI